MQAFDGDPDTSQGLRLSREDKVKYEYENRELRQRDVRGCRGSSPKTDSADFEPLHLLSGVYRRYMLHNMVDTLFYLA